MSIQEEICQNLMECEAILKGYQFLYKAKKKERRENIRSQIEAESERRTKAKLAFSLKQEGKTYKEIGAFFGVSSSRAKVLSDKGKFYTTGER